MKRVRSGSMPSCYAGVICSPAAGTDTLTWILFCSVQCTFTGPLLAFYCLHLTAARAAPGTRHGSHKLLLSCFLVHPLMQPSPCLMFSTCTLFMNFKCALSLEWHEKYNRRSSVPVAHSMRFIVVKILSILVPFQFTVMHFIQSYLE